MRILDVTRAIRPGMPVFPGDPPVAVRAHRATAQGAPANVSALSLGSHTGTHLDAPRHLDPRAPGVDALPLALLVGPAVVLDVGPVAPIDGPALRRAGLLDGPAPTRVLLKARGAPGASLLAFPPLSLDAAELLLQVGARLVGVEASSVDPSAALDLPVHRRLLGAGAVIIEELDLSAVPAGRYELACLPLKLEGGDGAPARVILLERTSPAGRGIAPPAARAGR